MTIYRVVSCGLLVAAIVALVTAGPTQAAAFPAVTQVDQAAVKRALAGEASLRQVSVEVRGQVVWLRGIVRSLGAKNRAIELVLAVEGVDSITSELVIAEAESDDQIGELALSLIRRYGFFSVFDDLNVEVQDGAVRLTGAVTEPYKKADIEKLVSNIGGVQAIDNRVEVLPVSGVDDRLRREIASQIYNDPLFSRYTQVTSPPIHIIVKLGRVRLTGVVISSVEREFASMIARQVEGVRSFRNELRVEARQ